MSNEFEEAERTELEGRSCIARIHLDVHGQPIFDRVAVSTAPWALGHAKQNGLSALGADAFAADRREDVGPQACTGCGTAGRSTLIKGDTVARVARDADTSGWIIMRMCESSIAAAR